MLNTGLSRLYAAVRWGGALSFLTAGALNLFPAVALRAQETTETPTPVAFSDAHLQLPKGWKSAEKTSGKTTVLVVVPPDFSEKAKFALIVLPGQDLKEADFKQVFQQLGPKVLAADEHLVQSADLPARKTEAGYDLLSRVLIVQDAAGHQTVRLLFAANPNKRLEIVMVVADNQEQIKQHQQDVSKILSSLTFADPAKKAEEAPAQPSGKPAALGTGVPILRGLWLKAGPATRSADGTHTDGVHIKELALDLTNHTLYVAASAVADFSPHGGIFASSDGGKTWQELYGRDCQQIVPTGTNRMYALESRNNQIIVSEDQGKTWTKCTKPIFADSGIRDAADVQCIAASPAAPNILYAGAHGVHGAGLYKSLDGGHTWTYPTRQALYRANPTDSAINCRDSELSEIVVDPGNPDILYARYSVFDLQSNDGGVHFYGCLGYGTGAGPVTREPLPMKVVRTGSIFVDPALPNLAYFRTRTGFYRTGDGGKHWTQLAISGVDFVNTLTAHPGSPQILYAATERGMYVSSDAGRTWKALQSADAPKSTGGFTIPSYFNGTAFNSVATVVSEDEPILIDPQSAHLFYGTALGTRILVPVK